MKPAVVLYPESVHFFLHYLILFILDQFSLHLRYGVIYCYFPRDLSTKIMYVFHVFTSEYNPL
jgi:hypothetical protein